MPDIEVTADPERFDEAIRQFRKRVLIPDHEWDAMLESEREFAFKVSGATEADLVADAWAALDRAIVDGTTLEDFKAEIGERLEAAWGGPNPARLETVFRTNTQAAYNGGRHEILSHPDVKKARPYWRFDAVEDSRTSDICDPLDGTVLPADDPFWAAHTPPLHFNCRSVITPLSDEEADDEGISPRAPETDADDGFGHAPTVGNEWEPDAEKYPSPIADILEQRLR